MLIDNKKTREISWNDFELEGNKENLINQGWESFGHYGSGDILLNYDDISDWMMQKSGGATGSIDGKVLVKTNDDGWLGAHINTNLMESQFLTLSVKASTNSKMQARYGGTSAVPENTVDLVGDNKFHVYSFILDDYGNNNLIIEFKNKGSFEISNIQISDANNKHLVVEKTPLENGLTRIQTWGGNNRDKLRFYLSQRPNNNLTLSMFVKNNRGNEVYLAKYDGGGHFEYIDAHQDRHVTVRLVGSTTTYQIKVGTRSDEDSNLDFIASDPQIVEGDVPNAVMVVDTLEDGREHVQVFGANSETKLVYTGGGVIKGEPYTLETEIENDGRIFNLSANMFDSVVEVQKGMNDIRKSGELQDKELKIEIGVD